MTIKAVFFDFGGVLVRTRTQETRQLWERKIGLAEGELSHLVFDSEAAIQATLGNVSSNMVWDHVARVCNLKKIELEQLQREFWKDDYLDQTLVKFITSLRQRYKTAILSNAWSNARKMFTDTYHLDKLVDDFFISSELGFGKPDPRIYCIAVEKMGVALKEAIFIDDMPQNVSAAIQLGMQAIQFSTTPQLIEQFTFLGLV